MTIDATLIADSPPNGADRSSQDTSLEGSGVIVRTLSDCERRTGHRYQVESGAELRIGRRWFPITLIDRSCSGFQAGGVPCRRLYTGQILHLRSEFGEYWVRVAHLDGCGHLGLEWIDEVAPGARNRPVPLDSRPAAHVVSIWTYAMIVGIVATLAYVLTR